MPGTPHCGLACPSLRAVFAVSLPFLHQAHGNRSG
jgi:hypothetical protein